MTEIARPPAAAADLILIPVAEDAVDASTLNAGFVAPFSPTASAFADAEVIVSAALVSVELIAAVPVIASAFEPIVAPLSASDVAKRVVNLPVAAVVAPMAPWKPVLVTVPQLSCVVVVGAVHRKSRYDPCAVALKFSCATI
jgi:hypothetical protein